LRAHCGFSINSAIFNADQSLHSTNSVPLMGWVTNTGTYMFDISVRGYQFQPNSGFIIQF
jgi:hypothetical protein